MTSGRALDLQIIADKQGKPLLVAGKFHLILQLILLNLTSFIIAVMMFQKQMQSFSLRKGSGEKLQCRYWLSHQAVWCNHRRWLSASVLCSFTITPRMGKERINFSILISSLSKQYSKPRKTIVDMHLWS